MRVKTTGWVRMFCVAACIWRTAAIGRAAHAGDAPARLRLADGGQTEYTIVVHPAAIESERYAARELATFLEQITGAEFPVRERERVGDGEPVIRLGPGLADGIVTDAELGGLGPEGYVLRTRGRTFAIAGGRPRGTLYGVYAFLDEKLGCRWFTPDVSRIPRGDRLDIGPLDERFVPPLEYRSTDYPKSCDGDWAARNRVNGHNARLTKIHGGGIVYGPFVHTFNEILHPDQHFAEHPEYFSEVDGKRIGGHTQLCVTNPEVLRIAIDTVRRWMRERPDATIFSVSQNDWHHFCTCEACARVMREEGSPAGPYLRFVNAIADAVRDEFPDKAISTLAYQFTRKPPSTTVPRPNVIVQLCDIECCFAHPLVARGELDPRNASFADDLRGWNAICDRLYIWDYAINYAHSIMPFPNLDTLRPNIEFFIQNGVKGIYEEANYFSHGGEFAELRSWIIAKTLWNPAYDTDVAIDEFLDGYYERAAVPLRRYIDLLHGKTRMDGVHCLIFDPPSAELFSDEVIGRADTLFREALDAVGEAPDLRHRVEVARMPLEYVKIERRLARARESGNLSEAERGELAAMLDAFERVARIEEVSRVSEGRAFDDWLAKARAALEPK